jgi:hypothetical protein
MYVHGEDAKRLLAYSPNMPTDANLGLSRLIMGQREFFFKPFFLNKMCPFKKRNTLRSVFKIVEILAKEIYLSNFIQFNRNLCCVFLPLLITTLSCNRMGDFCNLNFLPL